MFIHLSKKGSFKNFLFWIFVILNILDIIQKFQPLVFTYSHIKVVYSKSSNWSFSSTNIFVTNIWFFFKELLFCMSLKLYIFFWHRKTFEKVMNIFSLFFQIWFYLLIDEIFCAVSNSYLKFIILNFIFVFISIVEISTKVPDAFLQQKIFAWRITWNYAYSPCNRNRFRVHYISLINYI